MAEIRKLILCADLEWCNRIIAEVDRVICQNVYRKLNDSIHIVNIEAFELDEKVWIVIKVAKEIRLKALELIVSEMAFKIHDIRVAVASEEISIVRIIFYRSDYTKIRDEVGAQPLFNTYPGCTPNGFKSTLQSFVEKGDVYELNKFLGTVYHVEAEPPLIETQIENKTRCYLVKFRGLTEISYSFIQYLGTTFYSRIESVVIKPTSYMDKRLSYQNKTICLLVEVHFRKGSARIKYVSQKILDSGMSVLGQETKKRLRLETSEILQTDVENHTDEKRQRS